MKYKNDEKDCKSSRMAIKDTMEVINGKWKLVILVTLFEKKMRFKELSRAIEISPRILSRELQDLEMNNLVSRTVLDTKPVSVEYAITEYSKTLADVIIAMQKWGLQHRKIIIGGK